MAGSSNNQQPLTTRGGSTAAAPHPQHKKARGPLGLFSSAALTSPLPATNNTWPVAPEDFLHPDGDLTKKRKQNEGLVRPTGQAGMIDGWVDHAWGRSGGWETRAQAASCSGRAAAVVMVTRRRRRAVRRESTHARTTATPMPLPLSARQLGGGTRSLAAGN
jgi:hypothetical protein